MRISLERRDMYLFLAGFDFDWFISSLAGTGLSGWTFVALAIFIGMIYLAAKEKINV